ncbi:MAG: hypothetical protein WA715_18110 [Candidatus Acidiferrum sp.]
MNSKAFRWGARSIAVLTLAMSTGAQAQAPRPEHLSGIISDYTPYNSAAVAPTPTGPYEMRGRWAVHLKEHEGKGDFSAEMAMELSDLWVSKNADPPTDLSVRGQHTHHITMTNAALTYNTAVCPPNNPAAGPAGIVLTSVPNVSVVKITGNGGPAPFEAKGMSSLQVCITGSGEVQFSNLSILFGGPATGHFGSQAIHGVVRFPHESEKRDKDDRNRH